MLNVLFWMGVSIVGIIGLYVATRVVSAAILKSISEHKS
jgi:hypothetical protein